MKYILHILPLILVVCSCNKNDFDDISLTSALGDVHTLTATIEQTGQTRSAINFWGNVSWTENDYIGVFGELTQNAKFHYASNKEDKDNFTGNFDTDKEAIKFAYYPYNKTTQYEGNSIRFEMSEINEYNTENKAPMLGKVVSEKMVHFYQTGGVLLLKIIGMPQNAEKIQISSDEESPLLSGNVVIKDIDQEYPLFRIESGNHVITYDISVLNDMESFIRLYVPLQVGSYNKLNVSVLDNNNKSIKTVSLSDTEVVRGAMINTNTINCSEILYCENMPSECLKGTEWTEGMITSSEILMLRKSSENNSSMLAIRSLSDQNILCIVTDSLGNVTELIMNDEEYISIQETEDGKMSFYHILDNNIDYFEGTSVSPQQQLQRIGGETRAGVDGVYFFNTISNAVNIFNLFKHLSNAATSSLEKKLLEANKDALKATKDYISMNGTGNDEADMIAGLIGSNYLEAALEIAKYAENKFNKHLETYYNLLCGATISVTTPVIDEDKIHFGYSVKNTSRIPQGNGGYESITRKCYVSVLKQWNGTRRPGVMSVAAGQQFGLEDVVANHDFESESFTIPLEKGFTYYFIARIILSTTHTQISSTPIGLVESTCYRKVSYSSDIEEISSDNIGDIKTNSIKYENDQVTFDFTFQGEKLMGRNMGVELFHNDNKVWENFDNVGIGNRCVLKLSRSEFDSDYDLFKATAKGKWQLRSYVLMDMNNERCYSQFVDFDKLVYDKYPSVIFFNPIIQKTEELTTRSGSDDDDSKKYITFFSYGLDVQGAFWMIRYDAKSDTEGPIGTLSRTNVVSDGQEAFDYSWIYSEKNPISPTLWYDITLRNGKTIQSANNLKFTGFPISNIEYNKYILNSGD